MVLLVILGLGGLATYALAMHGRGPALAPAPALPDNSTVIHSFAPSGSAPTSSIAPNPSLGPVESIGISSATSLGGMALKNLLTPDQSDEGGGSAGGASALGGGGLAAGAVSVGIGAAVAFAAMGITDIMQCGTITRRGCDKRHDTGEGLKIMGAARQMVYQWYTGQRSAVEVVSYLQQLDVAMQDANQNPFKDGVSQWMNPGSNQETACGNWAASNWGLPYGGFASYNFGCGMRNLSKHAEIQGMIAAINRGDHG